MILVGSMVVDGLYFNRVEQAPLWYTPSGDTTVVEVKYVLQTGLQLQPISTTNALPNTYARVEAMRKKAIKVSTLDHRRSWRKQPRLTGWSTKRMMYTRVTKIVRRARRVIPRASSK